MTLPRFRAVLFDLDGTLVDTAPDFAAALAAVAGPDEALPSGDSLRRVVSAGGHAMVRHAFPELTGANLEARLDAFLAAYAGLLGRRSAVFTPLPAFLAHCRQRGVPTGIVTNKPERFAVPLCRQLALEPGCLICPEHAGAAKPDPAGLLLGARELGVEPEHCVYVGDDRRDVEAGEAAGMGTVIAAYGYIPAGEDPVTWRADALAASAAELDAILRRSLP